MLHLTDCAYFQPLAVQPLTRETGKRQDLFLHPRLGLSEVVIPPSYHLITYLGLHAQACMFGILAYLGQMISELMRVRAGLLFVTSKDITEAFTQSSKNMHVDLSSPACFIESACPSMPKDPSELLSTTHSILRTKQTTAQGDNLVRQVKKTNHQICDLNFIPSHTIHPRDLFITRADSTRCNFGFCQ